MNSKRHARDLWLISLANGEQSVQVLDAKHAPESCMGSKEGSDASQNKALRGQACALHGNHSCLEGGRKLSMSINGCF
jgi:hypothetical protein